MEPQIKFARTEDGVSIAYWTLGEGTPLVYAPSPPFSHLQLEWQIPEIRRWYERLASKRMLVRYDNRGCGLSQREVTDFSMNALVSDLEAVVERLRSDEFNLLGGIHAGPIALAYTARHPERVSRLLLWCTYRRASEYTRSPRTRAVHGLRSEDWELYSEAAAQYLLGYSAGEQSRQFGALIREGTTPENHKAFDAALRDFDVAALLPLVTSPTLVLHRRESRYPVELARELASGLPDARLVLLEGESSTMALGDSEAVAGAIDEFLAGAEVGTAAGLVGQAQAAGGEASAFRTILFTDIVEHTPMMRRLGDEAGRAVLREHERITRDVLQQHAGVEVKTDGDSFMASFMSTSHAVACAVALQRSFAARNESADQPILIRAGLNIGEPLAEDGDYFGSAVILGARIKDCAGAGEILVPEAVQHVLSGKNFEFVERGEAMLKGFDDAVRLYEVRWRE